MSVRLGLEMGLYLLSATLPRPRTWLREERTLIVAVQFEVSVLMVYDDLSGGMGLGSTVVVLMRMGGWPGEECSRLVHVCMHREIGPPPGDITMSALI